MSRTPNVILIVMDDMGYGDPGCYGNKLIRTPVMDSLAEGGVLFSQMYAAAPVCSPSRCGILTGRLPQKAGIPRVLFPDDTIGLPAEETTLPTYLKAREYRSGFFGKWHLGCLPEHYPTRHGFDRFYGLLYSNDMEPLHLYENETVVEYEVNQETLTENYTKEAIRFISENKNEPFFCYIAHTMPHIPLHVPEPFRGKSVCGTYGDTIECIDYWIGQLQAALRGMGLEDDTLIMVTSDNGPWYEGSVGGLRGRKFEVYEGGVRMPFIAQWKRGIPPGTRCDEVASLMDIVPTVAKLAGADLPQGKDLDGKDISALLAGEGKSPHEALYFYVHDGCNAIRSGKWKLHVARGRGPKRDVKEMPQLFDMDIDPGENFNLADRHPDVVERLKAMIEAYDRTVQPVSNAYRN